MLQNKKKNLILVLHLSEILGFSVIPQIKRYKLKPWTTSYKYSLNISLSKSLYGQHTNNFPSREISEMIVKPLDKKAKATLEHHRLENLSE